MSLICYTPRAFRDDALRIIAQANEIIESYRAQGYDLTLRLLTDMPDQLAAACAAFDAAPYDASAEAVIKLRERIFQCALMRARGL